MVKVVVDTNASRNENSYSQLLGNRAELSEIAAVADLYIPQVVIDEIVQQKRRSFENEKAKLSRSQLISLTGGTVGKIQDLSFDDYEERLRKDQSIPFATIDIGGYEKAFERIYSWALNNEAPFDKGSDKGFKDACIVMSIEHMLESLDPTADFPVFLLSNDARLTSFFAADDRVVKVSSSVELLALLSEGQEEPFDSEKTLKRDMHIVNANGDNEIGGHRALLDDLKSSSTFARTHNLLAQSRYKSSDFTDEEAIDLVETAVSNNQISWILSDADVYEFFVPLFERVGHSLTDDVRREFIQRAELEALYSYKREAVGYSQQEVRIIQHFIREVDDSVESICFDSTYVQDPDDLVANLLKVLQTHIFDDVLPSCRILIDCLIEGAYEVTGHQVRLSAVQDFTDLLQRSTPAFKERIYKNITAHLDVIDRYYSEIPF